VLHNDLAGLIAELGEYTGPTSGILRRREPETTFPTELSSWQETAMIRDTTDSFAARAMKRPHKVAALPLSVAVGNTVLDGEKSTRKP